MKEIALPTNIAIETISEMQIKTQPSTDAVVACIIVSNELARTNNVGTRKIIRLVSEENGNTNACNAAKTTSGRTAASNVRFISEKNAATLDQKSIETRIGTALTKNTVLNTDCA